MKYTVLIVLLAIAACDAGELGEQQDVSTTQDALRDRSILGTNQQVAANLREIKALKDQMEALEHSFIALVGHCMNEQSPDLSGIENSLQSLSVQVQTNSEEIVLTATETQVAHETANGANVVAQGAAVTATDAADVAQSNANSIAAHGNAIAANSANVANVQSAISANSTNIQANHTSILNNLQSIMAVQEALDQQSNMMPLIDPGKVLGAFDGNGALLGAYATHDDNSFTFYSNETGELVTVGADGYLENIPTPDTSDAVTFTYKYYTTADCSGPAVYEAPNNSNPGDTGYAIVDGEVYSYVVEFSMMQPSYEFNPWGCTQVDLPNRAVLTGLAVEEGVGSSYPYATPFNVSPLDSSDVF